MVCIATVYTGRGKGRASVLAQERTCRSAQALYVTFPCADIASEAYPHGDWLKQPTWVGDGSC